MCRSGQWLLCTPFDSPSKPVPPVGNNVKQHAHLQQRWAVSYSDSPHQVLAEAHDTVVRLLCQIPRRLQDDGCGSPRPAGRCSRRVVVLGCSQAESLVEGGSTQRMHVPDSLVHDQSGSPTGGSTDGNKFGLTSSRVQDQQWLNAAHEYCVVQLDIADSTATKKTNLTPRWRVARQRGPQSLAAARTGRAWRRN